MRDNFIRVELDKWAVLKDATADDAEVETSDEKANSPAAGAGAKKFVEIKSMNLENNVSATEYEAVDPKTLETTSGEKKSGRRSRKGRGKGSKKSGIIN